MDDQEIQALYASQSRNRKNYQASQEKKAALNDRIEKNGNRSFARTERMALEHAILEKQSKQAVFDYIVNDALLMTVSDELTDEQMAPFDELNEEFAEEINKNSRSTPPPPPVPPIVPPVPTPIVQSYVASGAKMMCPFAMGGTSALVVTPGRRTSMQGPPKANIMDNKPLVNIPTFGVCSSMANPQVAAATAAAMGVLTPQPCIPNIVAPWAPGKANLLVEGQPALLNTDTLQCAWGGVITLMPDPTTHTGSAPQVGAPKTPKASSCIVLMTTVCSSNDGETNTCVGTDNNGANAGNSNVLVKKITDIPKDILKDYFVSGGELITERFVYREWMDDNWFFKANKSFAQSFAQSKFIQAVDNIQKGVLGILDLGFIKEPLKKRITKTIASTLVTNEYIDEIDRSLLNEYDAIAAPQESIAKSNDSFKSANEESFRDFTNTKKTATENLQNSISSARTTKFEAERVAFANYDNALKSANQEFNEVKSEYNRMVSAAEEEKKVRLGEVRGKVREEVKEKITEIKSYIKKQGIPEWQRPWYYDQYEELIYKRIGKRIGNVSEEYNNKINDANDWLKEKRKGWETKREKALSDYNTALQKAHETHGEAVRAAKDEYDKTMREAREKRKTEVENARKTCMDEKKVPSRKIEPYQNNIDELIKDKKAAEKVAMRKLEKKEGKGLNNTVGKGMDKSKNEGSSKKNESKKTSENVKGKSEEEKPLKKIDNKNSGKNAMGNSEKGGSSKKNASNKTGENVMRNSGKGGSLKKTKTNKFENLKKVGTGAVDLVKKLGVGTVNVGKKAIIRTAGAKGTSITVKTALGKAGGALAGFALDAVFYLMEDKSDYAQSFDQAYEKRKQAEREGRASTIGQKMRLFADDIGGTYHDMGKDSILPWETVGDYANYTIRGYAELSMASEEVAAEIASSPRTTAEVIDNYDPKKANYKKYLSWDFHKELNEDGKVAGNLIGALVTETTGWKGLGDFVNAAVRLGPGAVYVATEVVKEVPSLVEKVAPYMAPINPIASVYIGAKKFF